MKKRHKKERLSFISFHRRNMAFVAAHSPAIISLFLMLMIFTSRLSLSVRSISLVISLALILITVPIKTILATYAKNPIARAAAMLFGCFIIGTFYSEVTLHERLHVLKSYLPLLFIGFLIAFFQTPHPKLAKRFTIKKVETYSSVFMYGVITCAALGCLNAWHIVDVIGLVHSHLLTDPPEYPFGTFSFSLSFAAYLSAQKMYHAKTKKLHFRYLGCFIFLSFFIFFVNHQRTAYILYAFLMLVYGYQHVGLKGLFSAVSGMVFLGLAAFATSPTFQARTAEAVHDVKIYQQGDPVSSTGLRLFFVKASYHLWKEKPLFGYGTGSFKETYLTINGYNISGGVNTRETALDQPHNDYAYVLVQLGLFGLIFFLFLLCNQFFYAFSLVSSFEKECAVAFISSFMVGSLDTTLLFYATSITDYFFFTALFYASIRKTNKRK